MKLKSTTDRVIELNLDESLPTSLVCKKSYKYANFLKTPLELGMFVPVDKDGNILVEPSWSDSKSERDYRDRMAAYLKAKDNVLFEGIDIIDEEFYIVEGSHLRKFYLSIDEVIDGDYTIEDLIPYNLTITQNAIKKYGL